MITIQLQTRTRDMYNQMMSIDPQSLMRVKRGWLFGQWVPDGGAGGGAGGGSIIPISLIIND